MQVQAGSVRCAKAVAVAEVVAEIAAEVVVQAVAQAVAEAARSEQCTVCSVPCAVALEVCSVQWL